MTKNDLKTEYMKAACLACNESNCAHKTGVAVVKDWKILLIASNYLPEEYEGTDPESERDYAVHAEKMLFSKAEDLGLDLTGTDLYVTRFPCPTCAEQIVEGGIKQVFYMSDLYVNGNEAEDYLKKNGIKVSKIEEKEVWGANK